MSTSIDQQFVEFIVKSLVGKPDDVKIERRIDEKGVLLELTVAQEDLGRVIGKRGATAQSLRTLLRALGTKNDARYNLKIVDPEGGHGAPSKDSSAKNSDDSENDQKVEEKDVNDEENISADEIVSQEEEIPESTEEENRSSDVVSKTRKELEDLDDLDI